MLIDAGLPGREIERRMGLAGLAPTSVRAVVLTHEHRDHSSGVGVWARRYGVPVYMCAGVERVYESVCGNGALAKVEVHSFEPGEPFEVAALEFTPFQTSHDSIRSVGFTISDGVSTLGFVTDLGVATPLVAAMLKGADALLLESNHDVGMLETGPYPPFLKKRIRSREGHLSNDESAALLGVLLHERLKAVVLAHLSETNNQPLLAYRGALEVLKRNEAEADVQLLVARSDRPGTILSL